MKVLRSALATAYDLEHQTNDTAQTIVQLIKNDYNELEVIFEKRDNIVRHTKPIINDEFVLMYFAHEGISTVKCLRAKHYNDIIDIFVENSDKYIEYFNTYEY